MQVILAYLPELIGMSGLTGGVTELFDLTHTIISNSGLAQSFTNVSGELFSTNLVENYSGFYNVDFYHNTNYITQGTVKFLGTSGYYIVDDPRIAGDGDSGSGGNLSGVSKFPVETGNIEFNQEYATKSAIDSVQIKINQIIDALQ